MHVHIDKGMYGLPLVSKSEKQILSGTKLRHCHVTGYVIPDTKLVTISHLGVANANIHCDIAGCSPFQATRECLVIRKLNPFLDSATKWE